MKRTPGAVLFDWDGTLVDSAESSFRCYTRLFGEFGVPFDRDVFRRAYSPNWYHTYEVAGLPRDRWPEADLLWHRFYAEEPFALIDEVTSSLERIRRSGIRQGVVTSGDRTRVTREMEHLGVVHYFEALVCSEDITNRKPHPEALQIGLERMSIAPREAVYIGDSPEDIEMARAAGVFAIAIPGGFPNRDSLQAAEPDLLVGCLREAVDFLTEAGPEESGSG